MLRHSQPDVVSRKRLAKALMRERRFMPEVVERVFRGDIQWSVDIDQGAVEIEKNRFEFARRQKILRASQPECAEMRRKLSSALGTRLIQQQVLAPAADHFLYVIARLFVLDIFDPLVIGAVKFSEPLRDRVLAPVVRGDYVELIAVKHLE